MGKAGKVTLKQRRFCRAYALHGVGSQAAREAGYSPKNDRCQAVKLLKMPHIQAMIKEERAKIEEKQTELEVQADTLRTYHEARVRSELAAIAFSRITDICAFNHNGVLVRAGTSLSDSAVAAIAEITQTSNQFGVNVKVKMHPKLPALQMCAQDLGMLVERHEITEKKAKVYAKLVISMLAEEIKDPALLERLALKLEDLEDG